MGANRNADGRFFDGQPGTGADVDISSSDATMPPSNLWVGIKGDVKVDLADSGTGLVYKGVQGVFPYLVLKVYKTGTTATDIISHAISVKP